MLSIIKCTTFYYYRGLPRLSKTSACAKYTLLFYSDLLGDFFLIKGHLFQSSLVVITVGLLTCISINLLEKLHSSVSATMYIKFYCCYGWVLEWRVNVQLVSCRVFIGQTAEIMSVSWWRRKDVPQETWSLGQFLSQIARKVILTVAYMLIKAPWL